MGGWGRVSSNRSEQRLAAPPPKRLHHTALPPLQKAVPLGTPSPAHHSCASSTARSLAHCPSQRLPADTPRIKVPSEDNIAHRSPTGPQDAGTASGLPVHVAGVCAPGPGAGAVLGPVSKRPGRSVAVLRREEEAGAEVQRGLGGAGSRPGARASASRHQCSRPSANQRLHLSPGPSLSLVGRAWQATDVQGGPATHTHSGGGGSAAHPGAPEDSAKKGRVQSPSRGGGPLDGAPRRAGQAQMDTLSGQRLVALTCCRLQASSVPPWPGGGQPGPPKSQSNSCRQTALPPRRPRLASQVPGQERTPPTRWGGQCQARQGKASCCAPPHAVLPKPSALVPLSHRSQSLKQTVPGSRGGGGAAPPLLPSPQ